ncbi:hypothetical protein WDU94_004030 [Cyamophila willieti]
MESPQDKTFCVAKLNDAADIVVVGSCLVKLVAYGKNLPRFSQTVEGYTAKHRFTGKGANQCVAAAKLGASVALVSKVGNDLYGRRYLEELQKYPSINTKYIWVMQDVPTGIASNVISNSDNYQSIIVPGANACLSIADLNVAKDLLLSAKVVLFQGETPWETTVYGLKKLLVSSGSTAKMIVNPSPAVYPLDPVVMILADIICMNELEAEIITNMEIRNEEDIAECIEKLLDMKCKTVIITLNNSGIVYASQDSPRLKTVAINRVENIVETDGMDDCFVGALTFYLCYYPQLSLGEIIYRSAEVARLSTFHVGLQTSFPNRESLNEELLSPVCKLPHEDELRVSSKL